MHVTIWYAAKTPELAERIARGLLIPDIGIDEIPEADYIDEDTKKFSFDNGFWYDLYFDVEDTEMENVKKITGSKEKLDALINEYVGALYDASDLCKKYECFDLYHIYHESRDKMDLEACRKTINTICAVKGSGGEPCICLADGRMYERCATGFTEVTKKFPAGESFYLAARSGSYHW